MSLPRAKKLKLDKDVPPARSVQHHTQPAHPAECTSGSAQPSVERKMDIAQPSLPQPVWAVVLCRANENATRAKVLLGSSRYRKYAEYGESYDISNADDLAKAVKARAQADYPDMKFVGPVLVYDHNPTTEAKLKVNREYDLREDREELDGRCVLEHCDVEEFFVLVTALTHPILDIRTGAEEVRPASVLRASELHC